MTQVGEIHPIDLHNLVANLQPHKHMHISVTTLKSNSNGLLMQFNLGLKWNDL